MVNVPSCNGAQEDHNLMEKKKNETPKVSEYEQSRQERIRENLERMQKLGIVDLSLKLKSLKPTPKRTRKAPQDFSPLLPSGPVRRSSRLQNATPVSYCEVPLAKKDKSNEVNLLSEEGSRPEVYREEHEKLLGSTEKSWTLFVDGYGKDGRRIYDPVRGKTCHQCRQKTLGHRTNCSQCNMVQGQFCGDCLYMRYGEHVLEAIDKPKWICPVCRGICNCSLCRQAKGWPPTGSLYRKISSLGYKSVAHYLIQTRRANPDTEETKVHASAKRSLPFSDMEATLTEKDFAKPDVKCQELVNWGNGEKEEKHLSTNNDYSNTTPECTLKPIMKPAFATNQSNDQMQIVVFPEPENNGGALQCASGKDKCVLGDGEHKKSSTETCQSSKKRIRTTEMVTDSIAGRLRERWNGKGTEKLGSTKLNGVTAEIGPTKDDRLSQKEVSSITEAPPSGFKSILAPASECTIGKESHFIVENEHEVRNAKLENTLRPHYEASLFDTSGDGKDAPTSEPKDYQQANDCETEGDKRSHSISKLPDVPLGVEPTAHDVTSPDEESIAGRLKMRRRA